MDDEQQQQQDAGDTPSLKKAGRGMSMRRRIGLKIEPEERERATAAGVEGNEGQADVAHREGEEWWKVEYKAPPPGHLGAHALPVPSGGGEGSTGGGGGEGGERRRGREDEHKSPRTHRHLSIERKLERMEVTAAAGSPQPSGSSGTTTTASINTHDSTPERRRLRMGNELYDASTSHSSPNQKRKIIDLPDSSMSVAKELKRFHETNEEPPHKDPTAAVTPSNLVRPMTKIDLQGGANSALSSAARAAPAHSNPKAPESA